MCSKVAILSWIAWVTGLGVKAVRLPCVSNCSIIGVLSSTNTGSSILLANASYRREGPNVQFMKLSLQLQGRQEAT